MLLGLLASNITQWSSLELHGVVLVVVVLMNNDMENPFMDAVYIYRTFENFVCSNTIYFKFYMFNLIVAMPLKTKAW